MPLIKTIDPEQLRAVMTDNPNASVNKLAKLCGVGFSTFQRKVAEVPELRAIYDELKGDTPRRVQKTRAAPPRNGHANGKGRMSDELLRKVLFEFESLALYDAKTEYFDDVHQELRAI